MRRAASAGRWSWIGIAAAAGFAVSSVGAGVLQWPRDRFVAGWALVAALLSAVFGRAIGVRWRTQLRRRWTAGLAMGLLTGGLLALTVLRQPSSAHRGGAALALDLVWLAVIYGAADALVLSVIPVLAIYGSRPADELAQPGRRLRWAGAALLASLAVTAAYHLGFAEFRDGRLLQPLIGNALITMAYLLSGSPVAPVVAHIVMHAAALLHGAATTAQLPPHY